jgi:hypothetical protein
MRMMHKKGKQQRRNDVQVYEKMNEEENKAKTK